MKGRKSRFRWYTAVMSALMALACIPALAQGHDAEVKALKENEAQWNRDFAERDLDKIIKAARRAKKPLGAAKIGVRVGKIINCHKMAGDSGPLRTVIPTQSGQLFR